MTSPQLLSRLKREIQMLEEEPPHGIYCWPSETNMRHLHAQIRGYEKTPYENGIFKLDIRIPDRYPFEPPHIQFKTPIYHPNVDNDGRICLDILKLPPKGSWKPSLNISTVLTSISVLMQDPNPDDPLLTEIANEYKSNYPLFVIKAKDYTKKYAITKINISDDLKENNKLDPSSSSESETNSKDELSIFNSILMSTNKPMTSHNLSNKKSISLKKNKKVKDTDNKNEIQNVSKFEINKLTTDSNLNSNLKIENNSNNNTKNDKEVFHVEMENEDSEKDKNRKLKPKSKKQEKSLLQNKKVQKKKKSIEVIDLESSESEYSRDNNSIDIQIIDEHELQKKGDILNSDPALNKVNLKSESENQNKSQNILQERNYSNQQKKRFNLKKLSNKESSESNIEQFAQEDKEIVHYRKRKLLSDDENQTSEDEPVTSILKIDNLHSLDSSSSTSSPSLNTPKEVFPMSQLSSLYDDNFSKPKSKFNLSIKKKKKKN